MRAICVLCCSSAQIWNWKKKKNEKLLHKLNLKWISQGEFLKSLMNGLVKSSYTAAGTLLKRISCFTNIV